MTVNVDTATVTVNGNDVATTFSFSPLTIYEDTDLELTLVESDGTETLLVLGTGSTKYSVDVNALTFDYPSSGGTPLATGDSIIVKRILPLEQQTDLDNQGGYYADVQETQFDKLVMIAIQLQEQLDRAVKATIGVSGVDFTLPAPEASKVLAWNSSADALENVTAGGGSGAVDSVNGQTGTVVLDPDDLDDTSTINKFTTASDISKLAGIAAGAEVNTVDSVNTHTGVVVLDPDDLDDTSTTNKFTTASDISKLAGIESGATADQSAAEILTAIKTVDGTGSGLDADLLDGNEATAFATAAQGSTADSAMQDLVDDTTPQLGGNLDGQGNTAASVALAVNAQTGTTYTLVLTDSGKMVTLSNASAITMTVPPNSSVAFPTGTKIHLLQKGAGQVTIAAGAGVTVNSPTGKLTINAQYGMVTLYKDATDVWYVDGRLTP